MALLDKPINSLLSTFKQWNRVALRAMSTPDAAELSISIGGTLKTWTVIRFLWLTQGSKDEMAQSNSPSTS